MVHTFDGLQVSLVIVRIHFNHLPTLVHFVESAFLCFFDVDESKHLWCVFI
jgi:hypothetical protein